ncbi:MAG: helix-turn-helix domain-containing protein [Candidatus Paceibacterales bacterium]
MSELLKNNLSKRVIFPSGVQQRFLLKAMKNLNLSWPSFATKIGVHKRTLNDWKREEYSIPLDVVKKISVVAKVKTPENVKIREPFWYVYKGAKIGGIACLRKYGRIGGDPEYRKKKWYEWWKREGRFKRHPIINVCLPIKKPRKSKELAEFVGIVIGDGGITKRQIIITVHQEDDKEYSKFVATLIKNLFNVPVGISYRKKYLAVSLIISRSELIRFCVEKLGLKIGSKIKQQIDIPDWIKRNKKYAIACVRGLVDTDGGIFTHRYKVNGKWYSYKKLCFTSYSKPLRQSVFDILKKNGLNSRLAQGRDIRLDSIKDMQRYFRVFDSHNPKHLKRYKK